MNLTSENIYSKKSIRFMCFRLLSLAALVLSAASQVQAENSLTGTWLDQENGIQVHIAHVGDEVTISSPEPFFAEGFEILKAGQPHFRGTMKGSTIEGTAVLYKARSTYQECGGPLVEYRPASIKVSGDSNSLNGRMAGKTFYPKCISRDTEVSFEYKRLSRTETTSACPQPIPPKKGFADSNDYSNAVLIAEVTAAAISGPPPAKVALEVGGKIALALKDQKEILDNVPIGAHLISYLHSLSATPNLTMDDAQVLLSQSHRELSERLAVSRMCVDVNKVEAGKSVRYYELNFYQVTKKQCNAIMSARESLKPILLNGQPGGSCISDPVLSSIKFWEDAPGTNQITFKRIQK